MPYRSSRPWARGQPGDRGRRTQFSWGRDRRPALLARGLFFDALLVGLLQAVVVPDDQGVRANLDEELFGFGIQPVVVHALEDLVLDLVELLQRRHRFRFELQQLPAALRAQRLADLANLQLLDDLPQNAVDVVELELAEQAAVGLRPRLRLLGGDLVEILAL